MLNSISDNSKSSNGLRISTKITTRMLCLVVMGTIVVFLVLGNLSRIISLPGFSNNVPIVSFILFSACITFATLHKKTLRFTLRAWPIYLLIAISCIYGVSQNGFELSPVFYAIRLILLIFSGLVSAHIFYRKYNQDLPKVLDIFAKIYMAVVIAGFLIYFLFPNSIELWQILSQIGIVFNGDPHQRRFYSTYLDPNFYAVIACLPFLICILLYQTTQKLKYMVYAVALMLSLFLAGSRSGIATFAFVCAAFTLEHLILRRYLIIRQRTIWFAVIGLIGFAALAPLYFDNILILLGRFNGISEDQSALLRVTSFENGMEILRASPWLGVGYNYLTVLFKQYSILSSVDSSILSTAINFGILVTIILLLACFIGFNRLYTRIKKQYLNIKIIPRFTLHLILYIWFVILFSSQFNNILYYEFWLLPMVIMIGYLNCLYQRAL